MFRGGVSAVLVACALLAASAEAGSMVGGAAPRSLALNGQMGRLQPAVRLMGDDKADQYGDPEAYVPQGSGKTKQDATMSMMGCSELRNLALRGGAPSDPKLQIVFVSAEIAPWSVTGGLGAVCDGLPRALSKLGHRVMSIAPRYDQYYDAWDTEFTAEVPLGESTTTVRYFHAYKKGVDRVFVDHPLFLEKVWGLTKQKLYGPKWGKDYQDNQLRFAMFCSAALVATEKLSLGGAPYGQDVIFVANDWHSALIPMYLKKAKSDGAGWMKAKVATLLHNLVFQGRFPYDKQAAERLGLNAEQINDMKITQPLKVGKQKKSTKGLKGTEEVPNPPMEVLNFMMGGCKNADTIMTVSPGYAREVANDPEKGAELEKLMQKRGIIGILNGVEDIVKPDNAELGLDIKYNAESLEKKSQGKLKMQKALGFEVDEKIPLFVFMGRLDAQKGVDVLFEAIDRALQSGVKAQFVTMGSGIEELEEVAAELEDKYAGQFKAVLSFKGKEKYKTYAAADFALMPSRYEPCGLVQMEGMRFGTLPIVAPTGGLADTVQDMRTGLVLEREIDADGIVESDISMLVGAMSKASKLYADKATLREIQKNSMKVAKDYSWTNAAKKYVDHFLSLGAPVMA